MMKELKMLSVILSNSNISTSEKAVFHEKYIIIRRKEPEFFEIDNQKYIPLIGKTYKEKIILTMFETYIKNETKKYFNEETMNMFMFNTFCQLKNQNGNFNKFFIGALTTSILIGSIFIENVIMKEQNFDEIIEILKKNNILAIYAASILLNVFLFSSLLNTKPNLFTLLIMVISSLFILKILDILLNFLFKQTCNKNCQTCIAKENDHEKYEHKFVRLLGTQLVFAIIYILYWSLYSYENNKKYYYNKVKPNFNKFKKSILLVKKKKSNNNNNNNNNIKLSFNNVDILNSTNLLDKNILYINESEKASFDKEMLAI